MNRIVKNSLWLSPIHLILLFFIIVAPIVFFLQDAIHVRNMSTDEAQAYGWGHLFSIASSAFLILVFAVLGVICSLFSKLKWFYFFFSDNAKVFFGIFMLGVLGFLLMLLLM
ncbi:MAG: hypothetical protein J6U05_07910 [Neisseriaceae bacterium]|nr:hypothetical protein [Neisseriaceae bacterium]